MTRGAFWNRRRAGFFSIFSVIRFPFYIVLLAAGYFVVSFGWLAACRECGTVE